MIVARVGSELVIEVRAVEYRPPWFMTSAASQSTPVSARPPTAVTDVAPLQGVPLKDVRCDFRPARDAAVLRAIPSLKTINEKPAGQFCQEVGGK